MPKFIVEEAIVREVTQKRVYEVTAPDEASALAALQAPANKNNNEIGRTAELEGAYVDGVPVTVYEFV